MKGNDLDLAMPLRISQNKQPNKAKAKQQPQPKMISHPEEQAVPYYMRPNEHQEKMTRMMIEAVPELNSEYATVPMANGSWHKPEDRLERGIPCFIPAEEQGPIKKDYIWMPAKGDLAAGYYHLRTQEGQMIHSILVPLPTFGAGVHGGALVLIMTPLATSEAHNMVEIPSVPTRGWW